MMELSGADLVTSALRDVEVGDMASLESSLFELVGTVLNDQDYPLLSSIWDKPGEKDPLAALSQFNHNAECFGMSKQFCENESKKCKEIDAEKSMLVSEFAALVQLRPENSEFKTPIVDRHVNELHEPSDKRVVDNATIYIIYPRGMLVSDFFDAVLSRMAESDYAWINVYCSKHHDHMSLSSTLAPGEFSTVAFIKQAKAVVAIADKELHQSPLLMGELQCLFEMLCAVRADAALEILYPPQLEDAFANRYSLDEVFRFVSYTLTVLKVGVDFDSVLDATDIDTNFKGAAKTVLSDLRRQGLEVSELVRNRLQECMLRKIDAVTSKYLHYKEQPVDLAEMFESVGTRIINKDCNVKCDIELGINFVLASAKYMIAVTTREVDQGHVWSHVGAICLKVSERQFNTQGEVVCAYACIESRKCFFKALEVYEKTVPSDDASMVSIYALIWRADKVMGDTTNAALYNNKLLRLQKKCETAWYNNKKTASDCMDIGGKYSTEGEHDNAVEYYHKALVLYEKLLRGTAFGFPGVDPRSLGNPYE
eukprot:m.149535 g.149535  ORF g.149535 m.149535 type:complete len:539 (+) comp30664_c0_seq2:206-1822(+)